MQIGSISAAQFTYSKCHKTPISINFTRKLIWKQRKKTFFQIRGAKIRKWNTCLHILTPLVRMKKKIEFYNGDFYISFRVYILCSTRFNLINSLNLNFPFWPNVILLFKCKFMSERKCHIYGIKTEPRWYKQSRYS